MNVKTNVCVAAIILLYSIGLVGCKSANLSKTEEQAEQEIAAPGIMPDIASEKSEAETISETAEIPDGVNETIAAQISNSFTITYGEFQKEIPLADCGLEYDSEEFKIYVKDIEYDKEFPICGTVVYLQTQAESMQIFGMQDYCVDKENGVIYILSRDAEDDAFASMYRYSFSETSDGSISGAKVISVYLLEEWLIDVYKLTGESVEEFSDLWLIMTSLEHDEQGGVILKGEASGIYGVDGRKYHVDWEIGGDGEEKVVPHEARIYDQEEDKEIFAVCEEAFGRIEECDKSLLTLSSGQVEYFTKAGEQMRKENEMRIWQRVDVNGDGLPELVASERVRDKIHPVDWIFAYTGGMTKTVEAVYSDLNDYTEYMFLGSNGNLVYDYSDHGNLDYGSYSQYRFDEKWERTLIEKLTIFYFFEDDYYEGEGLEENFQESFPDTYGKNGGGYYFFRTRLKTGVEPEFATDADWIEEEITKEEFVEAYREMTGLEFFEVNEDFFHE